MTSYLPPHSLFNESPEPPMRLNWLTRRELRWCLRFNRASHRHSIERLFSIVSRLGDGIFWYGLMIGLLIGYGFDAIPAVFHMIVAGVLSLMFYRWLKAKTTRTRPCHRTLSIHAPVAPLDEYSFPSGHTLHAVTFSVVAIFYYPWLAWVVIPFTALVALSRLILGLHYPSDVLAGALIGWICAVLVLQF